MSNIKELIPQLMKHLSEDELGKALTVSRQIINFQPTSAHYYYNHAMLCVDLGLMPEAADGFRLARDRMPECPIIRRMLSDVLLAIGQFREGFEQREWRFNFPLPDSPMPLAPMPIVIEIAPRLRACYPQPYWDGKSDLHGKTILVFNEAGHGDIIQNVRYLPQLKATGAKVILDTKEEVFNIMKLVKGVDEVISFNHEERRTQFGHTFTNLGKFLDLPPHDYVISLHSLLYYFDPDLKSIPYSFPYLFTQPSESEAVKVVKDSKAKLKIGIVWAGSEKNDSDDHRSAFKKDFAPLMNIPDVQLFSLQMGKMERNWPQGKVNLLDGGDIIECTDLAPWLKDFNDTAAVLKELDATVAVDTSVSHLAGALNVPVWTVLPDLRWMEWRWQRRWYGSQRVMAQERSGDWHSLLGRVAEELTNLCPDKNSA